MPQHEVLHILIQPGVVAQFGNIEGIGQETHVEDQIALPGDAPFEAEAEHLHPQGRLASGMQNNLTEHLLQGAGPQVAGIEQMVRGLLQGLQTAALLPDGLFQRKAFAA